MSTKNDLLAAWAKWTGDPLREVRHRIRVLSEAGLLPNRSDPMTYDDIARAILGFLASDTHKDAARAVLQFADFRCGTHEVGSDELIASGTLLQAISAGLRPPFSIVYISIKPADRVAELGIIRDGDPFSNKQYWFSGPPDLDLPKTTYPVVITRSIYSDLIARLAELTTGRPANATAGSSPTIHGGST
jgi:hypothetical protein